MPRVATLLPAATEIVCAIGARDALVGISHECDHPDSLSHLPRLTTTPIDAALPGAAIDAAVRALFAAGTPVIGLDRDQLQTVRATLLVTQVLCDVCAVGDGEALRLAAALDQPPEVLALRGRTIDGLYDDMRELGRRLDVEDGAAALVASMQRQFAALRSVSVPPRRVLVVEWLEPLFLAGHWTPELVALAGGVDVAMTPGAHSVPRAWSEMSALAPDLVIIALCGFDVPRIARELRALEDRDALDFLTGREIWLLDGHQYTSRPGPRLTDAAERIQSAMLGRPMPGLERSSVPTSLT